MQASLGVRPREGLPRIQTDSLWSGNSHRTMTNRPRRDRSPGTRRPGCSKDASSAFTASTTHRLREPDPETGLASPSSPGPRRSAISRLRQQGRPRPSQGSLTRRACGADRGHAGHPPSARRAAETGVGVGRCPPVGPGGGHAQRAGDQAIANRPSPVLWPADARNADRQACGCQGRHAGDQRENVLQAGLLRQL